MQSQLWFILAICLICVEIFVGFTIVATIFSISAITLGCLVYFFPTAFSSYITQLASYCAAVSFWGLVLWKPLKLLLKKYKKNEEYTNIIGQQGEVIDKDLITGKVGKIKWSGTQVKAMIDDSHQDKYKKIEVGSIVTITNIKNNIFIVKLK